LEGSEGGHHGDRRFSGRPLYVFRCKPHSAGTALVLQLVEA
jgi:hypothetical protein